MKVVDLHPEDLLDKELRRELTGPERARLEAHLERCSLCRFEREARADFADELDDASTSPSSVQRLLALVEGGGAAPDSGEVDVAGERSDAPRRGRREEEARPSTRAPAAHGRRATRVALLVAAALLVGGAAAASGGAARVWDRFAAAWTDAPAVEAPARAPLPSAMPAVFSSATAIASRREAPEEELVVSAPAPPPAAPVRSAAPVESAAALFEAANDARRQGDYARAIAVHRRLATAHPTSREAHVSHATVGRLLLDRGDAAGALASFDAYQARGPGDLDEAVLVGRATALERLGRVAEAQAAWRTLLATFPETPYAAHARARTGGAHEP